MNISANKMVTVSYTLRSNNKEGDIIEQTSPENPLQFVYGAGYMLPMFETNLAGLNTGDDFEMSLKANEAYGEIDPNAIVDLDKNMFMVDGQFDSERFVIGTMVPMQTSDGQRLNGIINNIDENTITMNFNHPLAGRDLHFTGNVIEVRDATPEELNPSAGCGCGSGGCDDSDCSSDDCGSGCNC